MTRRVIVHSLGLGLHPPFAGAHDHMKRVDRTIRALPARKQGVGLEEATNNVCGQMTFRVVIRTRKTMSNCMDG